MSENLNLELQIIIYELKAQSSSVTHIGREFLFSFLSLHTGESSGDAKNRHL